MHLLPNTFALPLLEVAVHGAVGGEVMGHHFPLTACSLDVKDAVENLSEIYFHRTSESFWLRQEGLQNLPLCIA